MMLSQFDSLNSIHSDFVLENDSAFVFPLKPGTGLRAKLWRQILSLFEEYAPAGDLAKRSDCQAGQLVNLKLLK